MTFTFRCSTSGGCGAVFTKGLVDQSAAWVYERSHACPCGGGLICLDNEPPAAPPVADPGWTGGWSWRIVPDGGNQKSLVFHNSRTGDSFYADGRLKDGDVFGQFRFSEAAVKRILDRMNRER